MTELSFGTNGKILTTNDIVTITLSVDPILRETAGYGFGYLGPNGNATNVSFFNVFGLIGNQTGYFTNPLNTSYGFNVYGYGHEFTETIRENIDIIKATVSVAPAGVYEILLNIRGPGQIYLYYDRSTNSYGPKYSVGREFTYTGITNSSGELELQIGVPLSANGYKLKTNIGEEVMTTTSSNKSAGLVELTAHIKDKISLPSDIGVKGTIINNSSYLSIPIIGYIV